MGQQCQAESCHGFIPCSLQSKTLLLAWTAACALLLSFSSVCLQFSGRSQDKLASNSHRSWELFLVAVDQWWSLHKQVCKYSGRFICSQPDHSNCCHLLCQFDLFRGNQLIVEYTCTISVSIALATFIGILAFHLASVSGITQYLKKKCAAVAIRSRKADVHVEPLDNDSLPDRLINLEKYEPLSYTPQRHAFAEPIEGANEVQRRLITPVYTYGSTH